MAETVTWNISAFIDEAWDVLVDDFWDIGLTLADKLFDFEYGPWLATQQAEPWEDA